MNNSVASGKTDLGSPVGVGAVQALTSALLLSGAGTVSHSTDASIPGLPLRGTVNRVTSMGLHNTVTAFRGGHLRRVFFFLQKDGAEHGGHFYVLRARYI